MPKRESDPTDQIHVFGDGCELYAEMERHGVYFTVGNEAHGGSNCAVVLSVEEAYKLAKWLTKQTRPPLRQRVISALRLRHG